MTVRKYTLALVALFALAVSSAAAATAPPIATLAQRTYDDPAIHYVAPEGVTFVGRREVPYQDASHMTPVAIWGFDVGKSKARIISISYERFSNGSLRGFYATYINEMRSSSGSGTFIRRKNAVLANGMPAYWLKISTGDGFNQMRSYAYVWYDGVRGVVLSEEARAGNISERQAKRDLAGASAVAYPVGRPY